MQTAHALAAALLLAGASAQERDRWHAVSGRVVDAQGQPVAGVEIARTWTFREVQGRKTASPSREILESTRSGNRLTVTKQQELRSDESGRFAGRFEFYTDRLGLMALTPDQRMAAVVELARDARHDALEVTLEPTVHVHGRVTCSEIGRAAAWTNAMFSTRHGQRVASCDSRAAEIDLRLPPGRYSLHVYGTDLRGLSRPVEIGAEKPEHDLGEIDVPAEYFALNVGKQLPEWHVTAARGVPLQQSRLADFRGRWLLVEFWGYW